MKDDPGYPQPTIVRDGNQYYVVYTPKRGDPEIRGPFNSNDDAWEELGQWIEERKEPTKKNKPDVIGSNQQYEVYYPYRDEVHGPFSGENEARALCEKMTAEHNKFVTHMAPLFKTLYGIRIRNKIRFENGKGLRESVKREKISEELKGFNFPEPPLSLPMTDKDYEEWHKNYNAAANTYRRVKRARAQLDAANEGNKERGEKTESRVTALWEILKHEGVPESKRVGKIYKELKLTRRRVEQIIKPLRTLKPRHK